MITTFMNKKVAVAGSFTIFHLGHMKLLEEAFKIGDEVIIGITSDKYIKKKGYNVAFNLRKKVVEDFVKKFKKKYKIISIDGPYDYVTEAKNLETIVVSEETYTRALEINNIRIKKGLKPLEIYVVKMVLAKDGKPISSSRIKRGEIDIYGNILKK